MYNMSMEQLGKALGLIKLLNEKGNVDSSDVAKEFNVSIRTAQRYLQEATRVLPIQSEEVGKNKFVYSLMESYSFKQSLMNTTEMSIMSALIDHAKTVLGKNKSEFLDVLKKKLFYANTHCQTYHILEKQAIDFKKISKVNEKLNDYITKKNIIEIYYERSKKTYKVEPYKILYWDGFWYLVAKHDDLIKKFLLDFIGNIKPTKQCYEDVPANLDKTINNASNIWFEGEGKKDKVTVEIKSEVANYFKRKQILSGQNIIKEKKNGDLVIEFEVSNEQDMFQQIIVWLPNFRVLKPDAYAKFILQEIRKIDIN
jgi:predicted DNA-binding transcriptional regulator YafY